MTKTEEEDTRGAESPHPGEPCTAASEGASPAPCEACGGSGTVIIGEHYVTQDMAIDAGDRSMAGSFYGYEWGPCDECEGAGLK